MKRFLLLLLNSITLLGVLYVNYFFASGVGERKTVGEVSDQYPTLLTPEGYVFSIWGLIYLLLIGFVVYQWVEYTNKGNASLEKSGLWFSLTNLFNGLWIVVWTNEYLGLSVLVIGLLFFCLVQLVIRLRLEIWDAPIRVILFVWWPICIYAGWIILASLVNISVFVSHHESVSGMIGPQTLAVVLLVASVFSYLFLTFSRNMREASLVGAWGISGIVYKQWDTTVEIAVIGLMVMGVLLLTSGYHAYKNRETLPFL